MFELGKAHLRQGIEYILGNDETLKATALTGLVGTIWREDVPEVEEIVRLAAESRMHDLAFPFLAGMYEVERAEPTRLNQLSDGQMRKAIAFYYCVPEDFGEMPGWYGRWLSSCPELVADVLAQCAASAIRSGKAYIPGVYWLAHDNSHAQVARHVSLSLLGTLPVRCTAKQIETLDYLLWAAIQYCNRTYLGDLIDRKLCRRSMKRRSARSLVSGRRHRFTGDLPPTSGGLRRVPRISNKAAGGVLQSQ